MVNGKYIVPQSGKGKELLELLRRELGIPDSVVWFTVRFARDEVVSVTCEYMAKEQP